jgi:hypothetical protein
MPLAELVEARLAQAVLSEPVKVLLKEALGEGEAGGSPSVGRLPVAVAWQQAARTLNAEAGRHASVLGPHWRSEETGFDGPGPCAGCYAQ